MRYTIEKRKVASSSQEDMQNLANPLDHSRSFELSCSKGDVTAPKDWDVMLWWSVSLTHFRTFVMNWMFQKSWDSWESWACAWILHFVHQDSWAFWAWERLVSFLHHWSHETCTGPRFPRILMNTVQGSCTGPRFPRIPRFWMQAELGGNKILPTDQVVEWLVGYTWMCPLHVYRIAVCCCCVCMPWHYTHLCMLECFLETQDE